MKTVRRQTQSSYRDKGSKFIGHLFQVDGENEFEAKLGTIKKEYPDATHHCYAWRVNPHKVEEFSHNDGEPGGTAGLPILNQLKSYNAVNVGCVVVRYYGGTNLGKSGLIKAYGAAARQCLEKALLTKIVPAQNFRITYGYPQQSDINHLKNTFDLEELDAEYAGDVSLDMACPVNQADRLKNELRKREHLGVSFEETGEGFVIC